MKRLLLVLLLACPSTGCAAVLVGGLIMHSSKSKAQQQEFMSQLQRNNIDRESKGLKPLDWCSEAYRFDKGWAQKDANCNARIMAYEKGDVHALDTPILAPTVTDSTSAPAPA
jgi:hypothetical protein